MKLIQIDKSGDDLYEYVVRAFCYTKTEEFENDQFQYISEKVYSSQFNVYELISDISVYACKTWCDLGYIGEIDIRKITIIKRPY